MKQLDRRTVLRGAGGVALALPFLDAMRGRKASAATKAPRRLMFVFQACGNEHSTRFRGGGENDFVLGEFLAPLEPYRKEILILNGVNKNFDRLPPDKAADNHQQGGAALAPWKSGEGSFPIGGTNRSIGYVEGPSADYVLGNRVLAQHPSVKYRSLGFRVCETSNSIFTVTTHGGPEGEQNPISPLPDPYRAYAKIFDGFKFGPEGQKPDATVLRRLAMQKSALDLVLAEANSLRAKVGTSDRSKIDSHLQSLSDIERSLKGDIPGTMRSAACEPILLGNQLDYVNDKNHALMGELFMKIGALAFACDLTRVINFAWSGNTSGRVYSNLGHTEGHHDISHKSDGESFAKIRQINKHLWTESVNLYKILKDTPDVEGTLWDNTCVMHWNELGQGDLHSVDNDLVVLAGGAGGHFKRGRLLQYDKNSNKAAFSDLLVNLFHYMGFTDVTKFGDPILSNGRGPLTGLTA